MLFLNRSILLVPLFVSLLSHAQQKAQNPCADPQTQAEMNECTALQYKKADTTLNSLYNHLTTVLQKDLDDARREKKPDQIKYCETALTELKEAERAWIEYRDLHCKAAKQQYEGGSMSPAVWAGCMRLVTEHRIDELKQAYEAAER